jgi:AmmeMemoRadiSam system protein A
MVEIRHTGEKMEEKISSSDGLKLLSLARKSIMDSFSKQNVLTSEIKDQVSADILNNKRGTFVTLHKKGRLRGCIGNIEPVKTIFEGIVDNARHAAFKDSRFSPLTEKELKDTQIEISILTQPKPLKYSDENDLVSNLTPHVDGVILEKGYQRATFLPQVWSQLNDPEDFLNHLCMKAGLPAHEWKTGRLNVKTYQVQLFEEQL